MTRSVTISATMGVVACVLVALFFFVPAQLAPEISHEEKQLRLYRQGVRILFQHQFVEAERLFQKLVDIAPDEAEAWLCLAMAQLNQAEKGVDRAVVSLDRAQALRTGDARIHFCRGIILLFLDRLQDSFTEFERALQLAPNSPDAHYQYAKALKNQRRREEALPHLEAAVAGNPALAGAWYQLYQSYQRLKRTADAKAAGEMFQSLDATGRGHPRGLVFTELGALAEPDPGWVPSSVVEQRAKRNPTFDMPVVLRDAAPPFAFVDLEADGSVELWTSGVSGAWNLSGDPTMARPLPELTGAFSFAVGDFTVDGRPDLAVGYANSVRTFTGNGAGFEPAQQFDSFTDAAVRLIDMDLEGDLDLVVTDAVAAPVLLVNAHAFGSDGPEETFLGLDASPLTNLEPRSRLLLATDFDHDGDAECIFGNDALHYLVDNGPQWRFDMMPANREMRLDSGDNAYAAADLDGDGWEELIVVGKIYHGIWWGKSLGQFEPESAYSSLFSQFSAIHVADVNIDGRLDILVGNANGTSIILNTGKRRFQPASLRLPGSFGIATGDVDGDLDPDIVLQTSATELQFVRNRTVEDLPAGQEVHALRCYLGGKRDAEDRRTNLDGLGARIEVLAGTELKSRVHDGGLMANMNGQSAQGYQPLIVGVGDRDRVETVLLWWPDGVVQSEGPFAIDELHVIDEVQRKESSCPVLFTWDGSKYRFITDFMGGGGLGFWMALDEYGPPDPTEVVRIEPDALAPIDGVYRLAILEPMEEVAYVDHLELIAVDHSVDVDVYPFELFATSAAVTPTGEPIAVRRDARVFPTAASHSDGVSCLDELSRVDRRYAGPKRLDPTLVGYTPRHAVELTFDALPTEGELFLFLDGWVEYPYSRINFAASHRNDRLEPPTFSWRASANDEWKVLYREVGYPAGMPKTMVLPLGELARLGGRQLRIETNMEVYWDRIFAGVRDAAPLEVRPLETRNAYLRFGGYPREYSDDGALPPTYHYAERDAWLPYTPMPGQITRYGDVTPLLGSVDDEFAIVGGGDELWMEVVAPPPASPGVRRTFLLKTQGYCKDLDTLTAAGDSVEPLPFEAMSNYPPASTDVAPDREQYRRDWNTRRD